MSNKEISSELDLDGFEVGLCAEEDVDEIAQAHCQCFSAKEQFGMLLGAGFVRSSYMWFLRNPACYVLGIRRRLSNELVGAMAVCDFPYERPLMRACRARVALCVVVKPWIIADPRVRTKICSVISRKKGARGKTEFPENYAQIAYTFVVPSFRGCGLGTELRRTGMAQSKRRGSVGIFTGVSKKNAAILESSRKLGFCALDIENRSNVDFLYLGRRL